MAEEKRNSYLALSQLAVKNKWCFNIFCPFCGHMPFRYAFMELAAGIHPDDEAWGVKRRWPSDWRQLREKRGVLPLQGMPEWNRSKEAVLALSLGKLDIVEMAKTVAFPEWLYIIGVGLYYTENIEKKNPKITQNLLTHLLDFFKLEDDAITTFQSMIKENKAITWRDLPVIENKIKAAINYKVLEEKRSYLLSWKTTVPYILDKDGKRWKKIADLLSRMRQQKQYAPNIYAYVFMPSEVNLVVQTQNIFTFMRTLIVHIQNELDGNLSSNEDGEVYTHIVKNGLLVESEPILIADNSDLHRKIAYVEAIPVECGYADKPAHWKWSSANSNNYLPIDTPPDVDSKDEMQ